MRSSRLSASPGSVLRPFHDRAETDEKDVVLRLVPDGDNLRDPGLFGGIEDRIAGLGRRIGGESAVADRYELSLTISAPRCRWGFRSRDRKFLFRL